MKVITADRAAAAASPRKAGKATGDSSKKLTVKITGDLDFRLYGLAASLGTSKAELVIKLIAQGIERYGLDDDLNAVYAKIVGRVSEAA